MVAKVLISCLLLFLILSFLRLFLIYIYKYLTVQYIGEAEGRVS